MTPPVTRAGPQLLATVHTAPKLGRALGENEDSWAVDEAAGRFAVADGASTSARPEVWSRLLVDAFVRDGADPLDSDVLPVLRGRWHAEVWRESLPWYAEAKLQHGAHSTFLGLHINPQHGKYCARGVGDSCLFQLRRGALISVGPVDSAGGFGRFPDLVSSLAGAPVQPISPLAGDYQAGDVFVLATDAIAQFLLHLHERHRVIQVDRFVSSRKEFLRGVTRYRQLRLLGNDDTTLCVVRT